MILKDFTAPNGALTTVHIVKDIKVVHPYDTAMLNIFSYANEQSFLNKSDPLWSTPINFAITDVGSVLSFAETWLIQNPDSPFFGGTIIEDNSSTFTTAKVRAWARVKQSRTIAELLPFEYNGDLYDSNKEQIMGAVQLAVISQLAGQPFSIDWTLRNNTSRTLDAPGMINVGVALGQRISSIFDTGRTLRDQIEAATTVAELDAIVWP